jgi:hypothetical protein
MNDRIQQLAEQATSYADTLDVADQRIYQEIRDREFAELIVQECVAICQDVDGEDNIDAKSGRQDCAVEIKEHFGIEPDVNENLRNRSTYFGNDI